MDKNLEMILEKIEEMKEEQLVGMVEGNESDNHNNDSSVEREQ